MPRRLELYTLGPRCRLKTIRSRHPQGPASRHAGSSFTLSGFDVVSKRYDLDTRRGRPQDTGLELYLSGLDVVSKRYDHDTRKGRPQDRQGRPRDPAGSASRRWAFAFEPLGLGGVSNRYDLDTRKGRPRQARARSPAGARQKPLSVDKAIRSEETSGGGEEPEDKPNYGSTWTSGGPGRSGAGRSARRVSTATRRAFSGSSNAERASRASST